jgi:Leucine-rich repeat (LRR) protein
MFSAGTLYVRDTMPANWYKGWEKIGEAKGEISVSAGKQAKLVISESAAGDLSFLSELGADDIQMLSFGYNKVNIGSLAPIGSLKKLKALNLQSTSFNSEDLSYIAGLEELEVLRLGDHKLRDESMQYVGELPKLQWLSLWGTGISDEGLKHLQNSRNLTFLALNNCDITNEGLSYLNNMTKLEGLQLTQTKISDRGLAKLKRLHHLKDILIMDNGITDAGLEHLKDLTSLEVLWINWNPVTDDGLFYLSQLKNLRYLYADRTEITDAGLKHLTNLDKLRYLSISGIGDKGIEHLSTLAALEKVQIQDATITRESAAHLGKSHSMKEILLSGDIINDDLLDGLRAALPSCKIWDPQRSRDYPMPAWRKKFEEVYRLNMSMLLKPNLYQGNREHLCFIGMESLRIGALLMQVSLALRLY